MLPATFAACLIPQKMGPMKNGSPVFFNVSPGDSVTQPLGQDLDQKKTTTRLPPPSLGATTFGANVSSVYVIV